MSLWKMPSLWTVAVVLCVITQSIGGPALVYDPHASMLENRELQPVYAALQNPAVVKQKIREVLKKNPKNRPAKVLMARLLLQEGDITTARATIEPLLAGRATYRPAVRLLLELAQASGNKKMEASAYARMLAGRPQAIDLLARKAESEGDIAASEKIRKQAVAASHPKVRVYRQYQLGRFYLRQGQFTKAITTLKATLPEVEKLGAGWVSVVHRDCALAFWGKGNREEALKESLAATEAVISPPAGDPELRAASVMIVHILTRGGIGTADQRAKANDLLTRASKTMPPSKLHSVEAVVLAVTGGASMEDLAARIRAVLKTAPKLDWALWAALYAGLSEPERTKDLLQILPEGSVQARIAEVERKAKAEAPARDAELEALLDSHVADPAKRTRILDAVKSKKMPDDLILRNTTQPAE